MTYFWIVTAYFVQFVIIQLFQPCVYISLLVLIGMSMEKCTNSAHRRNWELKISETISLWVLHFFDFKVQYVLCESVSYIVILIELNCFIVSVLIQNYFIQFAEGKYQKKACKTDKDIWQLEAKWLSVVLVFIFLLSVTSI